QGVQTAAALAELEMLTVDGNPHDGAVVSHVDASGLQQRTESRTGSPGVDDVTGCVALDGHLVFLLASGSRRAELGAPPISEYGLRFGCDGPKRGFSAPAHRSASVRSSTSGRMTVERDARGRVTAR